MTESRRKSRGFSLVEIAIVLAILGFLLTIGLKSTGAYLSAERRQTTVARLAGVDAALVNYVALQKRLPCPADGALQPGDANLGLERRDNGTGLCLIDPSPPVTPFMSRGVVPWVTLGITETEALDGWNNRITYRTVSAANGFTNNNALDMTQCATNGTEDEQVPAVAPIPKTACNANCSAANLTLCTKPTDFLLNRGIVVQNGAGVVIMDRLPTPYAPPFPLPSAPTAAAFLLISHGENRGGAYSSSGVIQVASPANSALENVNNNNQVFQAFYVDAPQVDADGPAHFDDILLRPTLMSVITRAQLGPRKVQ